MSCVECKSCGAWVDSDDGGGAYDKDSPFGWKCDECLAQDGETADEHGYRVPDPEATAEAECIQATSYLMNAINGRQGDQQGRDALRQILQAAVEKQK